ncbi:hypothetical protein [Mycolicibacterium hodleri]|uniref:Uncharacterized protein n=1 Tax=Mycolicibacterium hodleri TaxID=49897 RepID=A0A502EHA2_9MYCO|nr:hypothetical protein [Mycolicibacterium hodleri]TPG36534.1 hypothetical protein EAH80_00755 [Mycolicibacterium hodleri]
MYVNRFEQRSLAWAMMNVAAPHLAPNDRTWLWVKIGAGDLENALMTLVGICMRNDAALSSDLAAALRDWLGGYSGMQLAADFEPYVGSTHTAVDVSDVRSTQECSHIGCDRFGSRAHRVPTDRRDPAAFGDRTTSNTTADGLRPRGYVRGLSP